MASIALMSYPLSTMSVEKQRRRKSARFDQGVKSWDGLRADNADFDELMYCFIVKRNSIGDLDVLRWTRNDAARILSLGTQLQSLAARLEKLTHGSLPVLPRGGGKCLRVDKFYLPHLQALLEVLYTAYNQVK